MSKPFAEIYAMTYKYIVLSAVLMLSGCTTHRFEYELNKPLVANVGERLIGWSDFTFAVVATSSVSRELVYSGRMGNVVRLQYREFGSMGSGMMVAQQPMFQELTYDLSESPEITFKDIKLRIDGADSNRIQFVVLKGPSTAEKAEPAPEPNKAQPA